MFGYPVIDKHPILGRVVILLGALPLLWDGMLFHDRIPSIK